MEEQPERIALSGKVPGAWPDYPSRPEKLVRPMARDTAIMEEQSEETEWLNKALRAWLDYPSARGTAATGNDDISGLLLDAGDALNDAIDALGRLRTALEALRVEVTVVEDG